MISPHTVQDNVNKYRHGVLIGNFNQQTFGRDLAQKEIIHPPLGSTSMKQVHSLQSSLHKFHPVIVGQNKRTQSFYNAANNIERNQLREPENETTYNIFYKKQYESKGPILQNNSKRQEKLLNENKLFQHAKSKLQASNFKIPQINQQKEIISLGTTLTGAIDQQYSKNNQPFYEKASSSIPNTINPFSVNTLVKPHIKKIQEVEYNKFVLPDQRGNQRDILFGHGLKIQNDFHKRQFATTYDLSYNQSIKPQTQINSFFTPDLAQTAKEYHKDTVFEKNHQENIPSYHDKKQLYNDKIFRPYAPYTKTYDLNHNKNQYLRK